jgi:hypothetical protein
VCNWYQMHTSMVKGTSSELTISKKDCDPVLVFANHLVRQMVLRTGYDNHLSY